MCYSPETKNNLTEDLDTGRLFWIKYSLAGGMKLTTPDSEYSVRKCWWLETEENCSNLFLNHPTDFGWSFTFNPSYGVVKDTFDKNTYGIDIDNYRMKKVAFPGYKNGLQLLINVGQDDYCVTRSDFSAGLKILVHDPDIQPLYFFNHPLSLSPEYFTNIHRY